MSDIDKVLKNADLYFKFLPVRKIFIVAPENVREKIKGERFTFVNENEIVDAQAIRALYSRITNEKPGFAGWYIQQFIKMQFSRFTNDEYFLIWDSDTIPLKPVSMFNDNNTPIFDMKPEFNKPYFDTIKKILPGVYKPLNKSFISEHMIIKSEYMRELINEIESNSNLRGKNFQEKIISSINPQNLKSSGFSEFETYGYYVTSKHPGSYSMRKWHSLRTIKGFYSDYSEIDEVQIKWLRRKYDAVSLEKWQTASRLKFLVRSKLFRRIFSPAVLEYIDRPDRLIIPAEVRPFIKRILNVRQY